MRSLFINLAHAARGPRAASLALMEADAAVNFWVYWVRSMDEEEELESVGNGVFKRVL